jgi:hypothetical protein
VMYSERVPSLCRCKGCCDARSAIFKGYMEVHANDMYHIQMGCMSDMPDVNYYYFVFNQAGTGNLVFCEREIAAGRLPQSFTSYTSGFPFIT